jgi:hypothetical protein
VKRRLKRADKGHKRAIKDKRLKKVKRRLKRAKRGFRKRLRI